MLAPTKVLPGMKLLTVVAVIQTMSPTISNKLPVIMKYRRPKISLSRPTNGPNAADEIVDAFAIQTY